VRQSAASVADLDGVAASAVAATLVVTVVTWGRCYDCNLFQFSVKKMAFFSKTNVMIILWQKLAVVRAKKAKIFGENIFKIITSVAGNVVIAIICDFRQSTFEKTNACFFLEI
jgi:predicted membrane protein